MPKRFASILRVSVVRGVDCLSFGKPQLMLLSQPVTAGVVRRADVYLWGNTCNITALHTDTNETRGRKVQTAENVILAYNFGSKSVTHAAYCLQPAVVFSD